ncbi:MAG: hypothetical protein ACK4FA_01695 [Candidatus Paceibacteria bacterium]
MKNLFLGVMLILLISPSKAQGIIDSLKNETLKAVFVAAIEADTMCLDSCYLHSENWQKIVIDSTTIMWSADVAKIWPDKDSNGGFTFLKRDGVWFLLEKKEANINFVALLAVLQKLKACRN